MIRILAVLTILCSANYTYAGDFPNNVQLVYNPTWLGELDSNEVLEGIRLAKQDFEDACEINLSLTTGADNARRPYVMIGQGYQYPAAGWTFGSTKYNRNAVIFLNSWDPRGWTIDKVRKIVRHELGHALLEMPHSNFITDVMHPYASAEWWSPYEVGLLQFEFGPKYVIPSYIYDDISLLSEKRILYRENTLKIDRTVSELRSFTQSRSRARGIAETARIQIRKYRSVTYYNPRLVRTYQARLADAISRIESDTFKIEQLVKTRDALIAENNQLKTEIDNLKLYIDTEINKYN